MKNKIISTLTEITSALSQLEDEFFVIGSAALLLSNIEIGETQDIDILTSTKDSNKLQQLYKNILEEQPTTKEDNLFKSNFARLKHPIMDIEIMGDLKVLNNGIWLPVEIKEYQEININKVTIKIPTLKEQIKLLKLFGREKDLKKIKEIETIRDEDK